MKFHRQSLTLSLTLALLSSGYGWTDELSDRENRAMTQERIQALKAEINAVQETVNQQEGRKNDLQKELKESELKISQVHREMQEIRHEIAAYKKEIQQLDDQEIQLNDEKQQQEKQLASQVKASYIVGRQEYLKLILNLEDPHAVSRVIKYYEYFNQARISKIEKYQSLLQELVELEQSIAQKQALLITEESQLLIEQQNLLLAKKKWEKTIQKLQSQIVSHQKQLIDLEKDQEQFERLLSGVRHVIKQTNVPAKFGPFSKQKGKLIWPVDGKLIKSFGQKSNDVVTANGVLIDAQSGSEVKAIYSGRVVFADWMRSFGLMTIIDHGNGYMSLYAHNESLLQKTGNWVAKGDLIATVGKSGGRNQSGLYFEIRRNGKPDNPKKWMIATK